MATSSRAGGRPHRWVAATLVGMGTGQSRRAEHAARTGRHVLPAGTRVDVLEVYCEHCRVGYNDRTAAWACTGAAARTA